MTHEDEGQYAKKHGPAAAARAGVMEAVNARSEAGQLSCESAFLIADELGATPTEVGLAIDRSEIKLVRCQLGLFGYVEGKRLIVRAAKSVSPELEDALRKGLVNGKLPCANAWAIARQFELPRMSITAACEKIGLRIRPCQLGAF